MVEHRIRFAFKGKRKLKEKANMKNIAYPNQHSDIPRGSKGPLSKRKGLLTYLPRTRTFI